MLVRPRIVYNVHCSSSSSSSAAVPAQPRTPKLLNDVVGKLHGATPRVANTRKAARTIVRSTILLGTESSDFAASGFALYH